MIRVLKGNDVLINWTIKRVENGNPAPQDFTGLDLEVFLVTVYGRRAVEYTIEGNIIKVYIKASDQQLGIIDLDANWYDPIQQSTNRARVDRVIQFVDNPPKSNACGTFVESNCKSSCVETIVEEICSNVVIGGIYEIDHSMFYTIDEVDRLLDEIRGGVTTSIREVVEKINDLTGIVNGHTTSISNLWNAINNLDLTTSLGSLTNVNAAADTNYAVDKLLVRKGDATEWTLINMSDLTVDMTGYLKKTGDTATGLITFNAGAYIPSTSYLRIGDAKLKWDAVNNALYVIHNDEKTAVNFYSYGGITALGVTDITGGGTGGGLIQTVYGSSGFGGTYNDSNKTDTFNAYAINSLYTKVAALETSSNLTFTTTGTGNVVTSVAKSGTTVTVTKGITAALNSDLTSYITSNNAALAATTKLITDHAANANLHLTADEKIFVTLMQQYLGYDAVNNAVYVKKINNTPTNFYAFGGVTALGETDISGGSGTGGLIQTVYGTEGFGGTYNNSTKTDTFNAYAINSLYGRIVTLEGTSNVSVVTSGTGNVISSISKTGTVITATKGITAIVASDLTDYVSILTTIGTGNVVSTISKSGNTITVTKGITALVSTDLANYVTTVTVTGTGNVLTAASRSGNVLTLTKGITAALASDLTSYISSNDAALATTNTRITNHINDAVVHLTAAEKAFVTEVYQYLGYDSINNAVYVKKASNGTAINFYAYGGVTALGESSISSGGTGGGLIQTVYGTGGFGGTYSNTTYTDTFNAYAINSLYTRIVALETSVPLSFVASGSGNVVTAIAKSGNVVTYTLGATALTSTGVAASATKLATARKIWGQSFDGTGDVTGALSLVTTISASGRATIDSLTITNASYMEQIKFSRGGTSSITAPLGGQIAIYTNNTFSDGTAYGVLFNSSNQLVPIYTGTWSIGTSAYRWNYLYSTIINNSGSATITGAIYGGNVILSGGKTAARDGVAGAAIWNNGYIYLTSQSGGGIRAFYSGATTDTHYIDFTSGPDWAIYGNWRPYTTGTWNLGSSTHKWNYLYTSNVIYGGNAIYSNGRTSASDGLAGAVITAGHIYLTTPASTVGYIFGYYGASTTYTHYLSYNTNNTWWVYGNWYPSSNSTWSLGHSSYRWNSIFGTNLDISVNGAIGGSLSVGGSLSISGTAAITGAMKFNGGLTLPYANGTWISMQSRTEQILGAIQQSSGSAHSLYTVKNYTGSAMSFGGLGVNVGFWGFYASRISAGTNGTDWNTAWNVDTGKLSHTADMQIGGILSVTGAITGASTLGITGAITGSSTASITGRITGGESVVVSGGFYTNNKVSIGSGTAGSMLTADGNLYLTSATSTQRYIYFHYGLATSYTHFIGYSASNIFNVYGHWNPNNNNSFDLGTSSLRWRYLYTSNNIYTSTSVFTGGRTTTSDGVAGSVLTNNGNLYMCSASGTSGAIYGYYGLSTAVTHYIAYGASNEWFISGHWRPTTNAVYNLGTSTYRWNYLYAAYGNYSANVSISGTLDIGGTSSFIGRVTFSGGLNAGYIDTSQSISTNGIISSGWYRSVGAVGWYSQTYAGGWYMTDSTFIRAYGNKIIYGSSTFNYGAGGFYIGASFYQSSHQGIELFGGTTCLGIGAHSSEANAWIWFGTGATSTSTANKNIVAKINATGFQILQTTDSTNYTDLAALKIAGGLSVVKSIYAGGNIVAYGGVTALQTSDINLKNIVGEYEAMELLHLLPYFVFTWKEAALKLNETFTEYVQYGTSAQAVQKVLPDFVTETRGILGLNYNKFIPILMKATTEIDNKVTQLEKRVKKLELLLEEKGVDYE